MKQHGRYRSNVGNRRRAITVSVIIGALISGAIGCAPADRGRVLVPTDPDVDFPSHFRAAPHPTDPRPDFDCNANGIDDAFDIFGVVAYGPYPVGDNPTYIAADDLDGDGDGDLVVANRTGDSVSILWQEPRLRFFDRSSEISVGEAPACVATGDLDGDNAIDIVVAHEEGGGAEFVTLLRNRGDGDGDGLPDFDREDVVVSTDAFLSRPPRCVALADIDSDGDIDLLTTSGGPSGLEANEIVMLYRNDGAGSFPDREPKVVDLEQPGVLITGDLWGTGRPEIIVGETALVAAGGDPNASIIKNQGATGVAFSDWREERIGIPGESDPVRALAVADFDGNDIADLAVLLGSSLYLRLDPLYRADDSLAVSASPVASGGLGMGAADLDRDGIVDVAVPAPDEDSIKVLHGTGRHILTRDLGAFWAARDLPVSDQPVGLFVGNLDDDDRPEIAVSHQGTDDVWVLHVRREAISRDCNRNAVPDGCEIRDDPTIDSDGNGIPDECGRLRPGASPPR